MDSVTNAGVLPGRPRSESKSFEDCLKFPTPPALPRPPKPAALDRMKSAPSAGLAQET